MNLIRYNPNSWFDSAFDRLFPDVWPTLVRDSEQVTHAFLPRVDIREREDGIVLSAEIPGVDKDAVKVEVKDRMLTLSGEKRHELEENQQGLYRSERSYGAFKRTFALPETVDADKISARFENGVLWLTLPKKPEAKARQISIEGQKAAPKKIDVA